MFLQLSEKEIKEIISSLKNKALEKKNRTSNK